MITRIALMGVLFLGFVLSANAVPEPPTDGSVGPVSRSPDGSAWAAMGAGSQTELFVSGIKFGPYKRLEMPVWSPVGHQWYAFVSQGPSGQSLLVDGKLLGPFDELRDLTFDKAGTSFNFAFSRKGSWYLWNGGKESQAYQGAGIIRRPDGFFMGSWATTKANKTSLFLGGKTYGPYDWVNPNIDWMSADGEKYLTRAYKSGVSYLLQDGKETRLDNLNFEKAPASGYWLSWSKADGTMYSINGQTVGPFKMPPVGWGGGGPFFFENGKSWAMSSLVPAPEGHGDASQVVLNGKTTVPGWNVARVKDNQGEAFTWFDGGQNSDLVFSRFDGSDTKTKTLYKVLKDGDGLSIQIDSKTLGPYQSLGRPVVLADGAHWVVLARLEGGRFQTVFDGVEGIVSPAGVGAESLTLDPVGLHITYHLRLNDNNLEAYQITDNKVSGPFAHAGVPQFSANGKHTMLWSEPTKLGSKVLLFDGKSYGPFTGLRDGDRKYFDLENGHFVFQNREKSGVIAITDQGNFGPYEEVYPLATGHRVGNELSGLLWAFVGRQKNGSAELRVFDGMPGGGKAYPGVALPSEGDNKVSADGQDWSYPLAPPKNGEIHNGQAPK